MSNLFKFDEGYTPDDPAQVVHGCITVAFLMGIVFAILAIVNGG